MPCDPGWHLGERAEHPGPSTGLGLPAQPPSAVCPCPGLSSVTCDVGRAAVPASNSRGSTVQEVCRRGPGQGLKEGGHRNRPSLELEPRAQLAGGRALQRGESPRRRNWKNVFLRGALEETAVVSKLMVTCTLFWLQHPSTPPYSLQRGLLPGWRGEQVLSCPTWVPWPQSWGLGFLG